MKRITVAIRDDLYALLDQERRRRSVPAAVVVRDALEAHLRRTGQRWHLPFTVLGRSRNRDTAESAGEILQGVIEARVAPTEDERRFSFIGIGNSGYRHTARDMESILEQELGSDRGR